MLGPVAALAAYLLLPTSYESAGVTVELTEAARATIAIAVWMASWWLTEAVGVEVTALLPLVLFPLTGALPAAEAAAAYANEIIFLFLGGFILALSLQRWGLDRRIALMVLRVVGDGPRAIVAGLMGATAVMSMWVSNTATAALMLPVAVGVIAQVQRDGAESRGFAPAALLGIAYAASIGGMATIIGSPPNVFLVSYLSDTRGEEVSLVAWMAIGVPIALVMLPLTWLFLTRVAFRVPRTGAGTLDVGAQLRGLGRPSPGEWATFGVFCVTVALWVTRPLLEDLSVAGRQPLSGLTDANIAVSAALALFVIPVAPRERTFVMDWPTASRLPWGVLILFGGGLSLARGIDTTGVGDFLAAQVSGLDAGSVVVLILVVAAITIFLTEITSNTATAAAFIPVLAGIAPGLGVHPYALVFPVAFGASMAFMMPVATPPNAIVYASGRLTIAQMARTGFALNLLAIAVVTVAMYFLMPAVLDVTLSTP